MVIDLKALVWLAVLALVAFYTWRAFQARDRALAAARRHCQRMEVQMLDQAVFMRGLWLRRDRRGRPGLWRAFHFEFTVTGSDRYTGRVLMLGRHIHSVELEPHRLH